MRQLSQGSDTRYQFYGINHSRPAESARRRCSREFLRYFEAAIVGQVVQAPEYRGTRAKLLLLPMVIHRVRERNIEATPAVRPVTNPTIRWFREFFENTRERIDVRIDRWRDRLGRVVGPRENPADKQSLGNNALSRCNLRLIRWDRPQRGSMPLRVNLSSNSNEIPLSNFADTTTPSGG